MSGVFKAIGKVFSAVWDFVRPVVEVVAIAAAAYFTVGLAMSAFPATQAFAAALPGFASTGGVAGEGVFSSLADTIGLGGGLQAGAADASSAAIDASMAAQGASAAGAASITPAADTAIGSTVGTVGSAAPATVTPGVVASGTDVAGAAAAPTASLGGAASGAAGTSAAGLSSAALTNKLLLASVGANLISGLTAPSPTDIAAAKAGFYGSYYGMDSNGSSAPAPNLSVGPQSEPGNSSGMGGFAQAQIPGVNVPTVGASTPAPGVPGFQGTQKASLLPVVPQGAITPQGQVGSNQVQGSTALSQPQLIPTAPAAPAIIPGAAARPTTTPA